MDAICYMNRNECVSMKVVNDKDVDYEMNTGDDIVIPDVDGLTVKQIRAEARIRSLTEALEEARSGVAMLERRLQYAQAIAEGLAK